MAGFYKIVSCANENLALDVALTGDLVRSQIISERTNVNLQLFANVYSMMWYIDNLGSTAAQEIRTRTNLVFMLNAQSPSSAAANCDVFTTNSDTKIKIVPVSGDIYRFQLNSTSNRYLTAAGTTAGSNVNWQALNSAADTQKWKIVKLPIEPYPKAPTDYTYAYVTSGTVPFYLITVDAARIGVVNVVTQNSGIPAPYCGCNGGFFESGNVGSINIALNKGVPVGPAFKNGQSQNVVAGEYNDCGAWIIAYYGGKIRFEWAKHAADLISALGGPPDWAQGGVSLWLGNKNWTQNWEVPGLYPVNSKSVGRTMLLANKYTNKVCLFVQQTGSNGKTYSIAEFRETIRKYLGIPEDGPSDYVGLMLDGGGSSCLRGYDSAGNRIGKDTTRPLHQIIYIKPE